MSHSQDFPKFANKSFKKVICYNVNMGVCITCSHSKPESEFYQGDGIYFPWCRDCHNEYLRQFSEHILIPTVISPVIDICKRLRELNGERPPRYHRSLEHRIKRLKYEKQWREQNPQRYKVIRLHYDHSLKGRSSHLNRDSRRRANGGRQLKSTDIQFILTRDNNICHICHKKVRRDLSFDHLIPLSKGGDNSPNNIRVAHLKCNISRSNYKPAQLLMGLKEINV